MANKKSPAKKSASVPTSKSPAKKAPAKAPAPTPKATASRAASKPKAPAAKPKAPAAKPTAVKPTAVKLKASVAKPATRITLAKPEALDGAQVPHLDGSAAKPNMKLTSFVVKQKQRLLDLRDELTDALVGVTRDTLRNAPSGSEASGSGMHQGDAGSDAYDRDFALSVLAKEQDALYEIAQALRRVDKGLYGVCEISGKKIPQARLEAIPFARLTVECQAEWEKEHGNRRFRPANEVGFGGGFYETDESESVSLDDDED